MSAPVDDATAALQDECHLLSRQSSALAMALARRRADVALLRAEAATLAVALESAKEALNDLLRKEAAIRTKAAPSPRATPALHNTAPQSDPGLFRALQAQIDVTNHAVRAAADRKGEVEAEIHRLRKLTLDTIQEDDVPDSVDTHMPLSAHEGDPRGGAPEPVVLQPDVTLSQKKRKARHDREVAVLRMLKEGAASNSSFRFDHARIWRDVTMPNLALIPVADDIAASDVMLGVVIERIFEGITCFTPTTSAKESTASATDFRIDASGAIQGANENLAKLVAPHFGTLTVGATDDSTRVRVVAPAVALARIMDLIGDVDGDKVRRPLATLPNDREPVALGRKSSVDMTRSPKGQLRSKPDATQLPPIAIKLSTTSHVLSPEHIPSIVGAGVPKRFHECGLRLLYSTNEHGMSLLTLYNRVKTASPTLLVIRDTKDRVFGCYAAAPWKASSARYYGTGESFVFGTDGPDVVKVYKWSRENSFFQFTSHSFLAIGGGAGSHFALWVDEDLLMGTTSACSTFASPPLTNTLSKGESNCTEFKIVTLEVWTFDAHMSH